MAIIERDEIKGISKGQKNLCPNCFDEDDMRLDNLITQADLEGDKLYFCDDCGEPL